MGGPAGRGGVGACVRVRGAENQPSSHVSEKRAEGGKRREDERVFRSEWEGEERESLRQSMRIGTTSVFQMWPPQLSETGKKAF